VINEKRKRVILVLGVHRSGTSALAGTLQFLGVDLGSNLMPASEFNPRGYFEHLGIVEINDKILSAIDSSWNDPKELPDNWSVRFPAVLILKEDLKKIISRDFGGSAVFAIKDPRLCLLLPLYLEIFQDLDIDLSFINIQRAPAEVAFSLGRSEKLGLVQALQLYRKYQKYLEKYLIGHRVATVKFNQLLSNPAQTIALIKNLVPEIPFGYQVRQKEIDTFLDSQLKHFGQQSQDDCLFALLDNLNENERIISLANQTIEQSKENLDKMVVERERLQQECLDKGAVIAEHRKQSEKLEQEKIDLKKQKTEQCRLIESQQEQLVAIHNSLTWKLQRKLDKFLDLALGTNTSWRRGYHQIINKLNFILGKERREEKIYSRVKLADKFLSGEGIEIGALHNPLGVDKDKTRVHYVDCFDIEKIKEIYPEINIGEVIAPEIVAKAEDLGPIADNSQDFIIANHLLEHVSNPIKALAEFHRVARKESGIIFLTLPHKIHNFDSDRETTKLRHLKNDFSLSDENREELDLDHYLDWAVCVNKIDDLALAGRTAKKLAERGYPIHFHVFDYRLIFNLINDLRISYGIDFEIIYSQKDDNEFIFILRPRASINQPCVQSPWQTDEVSKHRSPIKNGKAHWAKFLDKTAKISFVFRNIPGLFVRNPFFLKKFVRLFFSRGPYFALQNIYDLLQLQASQNIIPKFNRVETLLKIRDYNLIVKNREKMLSIRPEQSPARQVVFSIIMPVYDIDVPTLQMAIDSVKKQIYPKWELCIGNGSQKENLIKMLNQNAQNDTRIKVKHLGENKGISTNSNEALSLATGEFIALMDYDDTLSPDALWEVSMCLKNNPQADLIYSDEDKIDFSGKYCQPFFKPDWSPDLLLSMNYIGHLIVCRRKVFDQAGQFRPEFDGSQDYDLLLRATELTVNIFHIPRVLYHWRMTPTSVAFSLEAKPYCNSQSKKVIADALRRRGVEAKIVDNNSWPFQIRYEIARDSFASIIIPTKDQPELLTSCVKSIINKTTFLNYEIIIVNNNSQKEETKKCFAELLSFSSKIKLIDYPLKFNYSAINNFAVSKAQGNFLLFLNDDTEVINDDWLEVMIGQAQKKEVGAVGAKLLYPDKTIQHAGIIFGTNLGVAHAFCRWEAGTSYFGLADAVRNYEAVTGACLMIRREVFEKIGGFDEAYLVPFSDVELCLQVRKAGYLIIYTPLAELYHKESASRGLGIWEKDSIRFRERWNDKLTSLDPYYNPNLSRENESLFRWRGY